jgi:hypothetical protein
VKTSSGKWNRRRRGITSGRLWFHGSRNEREQISHEAQDRHQIHWARRKNKPAETTEREPEPEPEARTQNEKQARTGALHETRWRLHDESPSGASRNGAKTKSFAKTWPRRARTGYRAARAGGKQFWDRQRKTSIDGTDRRPKIWAGDRTLLRAIQNQTPAARTNQVSWQEIRATKTEEWAPETKTEERAPTWIEKLKPAATSTRAGKSPDLLRGGSGLRQLSSRKPRSGSQDPASMNIKRNSTQNYKHTGKNERHKDIKIDFLWKLKQNYN